MMATTTGALFFNAPRTLRAVSAETWTVINEAKRDTRKAIQDMANVFLDL